MNDDCKSPHRRRIQWSPCLCLLGASYGDPSAWEPPGSYSPSDQRHPDAAERSWTGGWSRMWLWENEKQTKTNKPKHILAPTNCLWFWFGKRKIFNICDKNLRTSQQFPLWLIDYQVQLIKHDNINEKNNNNEKTAKTNRLQLDNCNTMHASQNDRYRANTVRKERKKKLEELAKHLWDPVILLQDIAKTHQI